MTIATLFTNNRSQAVRFPADVRFPEGVKKVLVRARGAERVISPVNQTWDSFFHDGPVVTDDFLPERAVQTEAQRESL